MTNVDSKSKQIPKIHKQTINGVFSFDIQFFFLYSKFSDGFFYYALVLKVKKSYRMTSPA